jgi:hypothetical protein
VHTGDPARPRLAAGEPGPGVRRLTAGFGLWFYTLIVPVLVKEGVLGPSILAAGPFGQDWLRPMQLFGLTGLDSVSHGLFWSFDLAVLERARRARRRPPLRNTALCTMRLAAALHPGWTDVTLESLAARLGVPVVARHTARGDALVVGALMLGLLPAIAGRGHRTLSDALWFQRSVLL